MKVSRGKKIVLSWLVAALTSGALMGCAQIEEAYLLNHLIYATGSDPKEMQEREIERQKFEYEEYLDYTERYPAPGSIEEHSGSGIPILTVRF